MQLEEVKGKSKKTGKEYTAYCVKIGEYRTPYFFPSKVELIYIKQHIRNSAEKDFQSELDWIQDDDTN